MNRTKMTLDDARESSRAALPITHVASILNVDTRTVHRGIADGTLPSVRLGRRVLVPRERFLSLFDPKPESAA